MVTDRSYTLRARLMYLLRISNSAYFSQIGVAVWSTSRARSKMFLALSNSPYTWARRNGITCCSSHFAYFM